MKSRPDEAEQSTVSPELGRVIEQVTNELLVGQPVDVDELLTKYGQHAEQLAQLLPAMELMAGLARSNSGENEGEHSTKTERRLQSGVLGDYRIVREIGRGGMGVVYEAEQISLARRVALKVFPFAAMLDERYLQRFRREAQAAASLRHPNIVSVHTVGCERGVHYYAMDFVDGQSLAELVDELRLTHTDIGIDTSKNTETRPIAALSTEYFEHRQDYFKSVARLGVEAAEALQYAHNEGVIHRDIKPANLLINRRGKLFITDFGLAQFQGDQSLTMTGDIVGTLRYMSPEQVQGTKLLDARTDVYSLGITLYELLTLHRAFSEENRQKLLKEVADQEPCLPRKLDSSVPAVLETIVLKATAKEAEHRYATAQELAEDLGRFVQERPIKARRSSPVYRAWWWCKRNPLAAALSAIIVALLTTLAIMSAERAISSSDTSRSSSNGVTVRRIWSGPEVELSGAVSPDGRYLTFAHSPTANLALRDLSKRENRLLTGEGTWDEPYQSAEASVWSPDSRLIAYNWDNNGVYELRVVSLDGVHRLVYGNKELKLLWPHGWTADQRHILTTLQFKDGACQIVLISARDGTLRILRDSAPRTTEGVRLSPDGQHLIYDRWSTEDDTNRDIYSFDMVTGKQTPLIEHPANDRAAIWSPDGKCVVFISDRSGIDGLWMAEVSEGNPLGRPQLIQSDLRGAVPLGFSERGEYYFGQTRQNSDIYTATLDLQSASVAGPIDILTQRYEGSNRSATWSPDGKRLAFLSSRATGDGIDSSGVVVVVRTVEDEGEITHSVNLRRHTFPPWSPPSWTPDGKSIVLTGIDRGGRQGFYVCDAHAGVLRLFLQSRTGEQIGQPRWTADGKTLFYIRRQGYTDIAMRRNLITDRQVELFREKVAGRVFLALSPDETRLAMLNATSLTLFPAAGGESRVVFRSEESGLTSFAGLQWTLDGSQLIFGVPRGESPEVVALLRIAAEGGEPKEIGIRMADLSAMSIHPDGRQIVFTSRTDGRQKAVWVLENVLFMGAETR